jgi:DNA-binding NtrC family response regulator
VRELKNLSERLILRCRSARIGVENLPPEVLPGRRSPRPVTQAAAPPAVSVPEALFDRIVKDGESFWAAVYEPFLSRDLTRADLRELVRLGLEHTRGNYKLLTTSFNMRPEDYKRFMGFLRKYQCHLPFRRFRVVRTEVETEEEAEHAMSVN